MHGPILSSQGVLPHKPWFAKYPMCSGVGQHLCTVCPRTSDLTSPGEQAHDPQVASLNGVRRADLLQEPAGGNAARTPAPRIGLQEQKVMLCFPNYSGSYSRFRYSAQMNGL